MLRNIELKILNEGAIIPYYATKDSAAVDLVACIDHAISINPGKVVMIPTGISINMQTVTEECVAFILPRSGKGSKEGKVLGNGTGVIDQDYQGEIKIAMCNRNPDYAIEILPGEKIAQLIFLPIIKAHFQCVSAFSSDTERGAGGFGSTDWVDARDIKAGVAG